MHFVQVLGTADEQITRVLGSVAQNWLSWFIKVRKVKAIYHTLNMFLVQPRNYVAECWCRVADIPYIQTALNRGGVNIAYVNLGVFQCETDKYLCCFACSVDGDLDL